MEVLKQRLRQEVAEHVFGRFVQRLAKRTDDSDVEELGDDVDGDRGERDANVRIVARSPEAVRE